MEIVRGFVTYLDGVGYLQDRLPRNPRNREAKSARGQGCDVWLFNRCRYTEIRRLSQSAVEQLGSRSGVHFYAMSMSRGHEKGVRAC